MEAAEIYYYQNTATDNVVGEEEELMNDFIVKSGIIEFDNSESEDEDSTCLQDQEEVGAKILHSHEEDEMERKVFDIKQEETLDLFEGHETKPEICDEVIVPDAHTTIHSFSNSTKFDNHCEPIKILSISHIDKEHIYQGNHEDQNDESLTASMTVSVKQEPIDEDHGNCTGNDDGNYYKNSDSFNTSIRIKQEPMDYDSAQEEMLLHESKEEVDAFIDNSIFGDFSNDIQPSSTNVSDGHLLRQMLQTTPPTDKIGCIGEVSKIQCREVGEIKEKPDYLFKVESVDMKGINIHYRCFKCGEVIKEYTSILFLHQCTLDVTTYPTLRCFYCRKFSVVNVEYIKNHFAGILEDFRKNKKVTYYKCFYDKCVFVTPSASCLSLHINSEHLDSPISQRSRRDAAFEQFLSCPFCQHKFRHRVLLQRHLSAYHPSASKPNTHKYACDTCDFKAVFLSSLKVHLNFAHKKMADKIVDFSKYLIDKKK